MFDLVTSCAILDTRQGKGNKMIAYNYINPKAIQTEQPKLYADCVKAAMELLNSLPETVSAQILANAKRSVK